MSIEKIYFGTLDDGRDVSKYILKNKNGMTVEISEFGAAMVKLFAPDKDGTFSDVIFGYDSLRSYTLNSGYQGAIVGRWANRIAKGRFSLDGVEYQLSINNGENHLHGGIKDKLSHKLWSCDAHDGEEPSLVLNCVLSDGDEGYPGNLSVTVTYKLTNDNAVFIHYEATTDKKTIVNLTNHAYFNLGGYASGKIYDHILTLDVESYVKVGKDIIPTGELVDVSGTPFDFNEPRRIGDSIFADHPDTKSCNGLDHCLNFKNWRTKPQKPVYRGSLYCPSTGREMELYTDQPCVQVYSGNSMKNPDFPYKAGYPQTPHSAVCLETQCMPDSINHEDFTNGILDIGEKYDYTTIYKFNVK